MWMGESGLVDKILQIVSASGLVVLGLLARDVWNGKMWNLRDPDGLWKNWNVGVE
jgi:hypothetical protein